MFSRLSNVLINFDDSKSGYASIQKTALWRKIIKKNIREICSWLIFFAVLGVLYKFASDRSFSAILSFSALFQCFGFLILLIKVVMQSSAAGISLRSLHLFGIATSSRLLCNTLYHSYLPVDSSGDWLYQLADGLTILLIVVLCALMYCRYANSYPAELDCFSPVCPHLTTIGPAAVAFVLACLVRPSLAPSRLGDISWCFGLYLETFAMLPQLFLMSRVGGEVEAMTSHYIASIAASKGLGLFFWIYSYGELVPKEQYSIAGTAVILAYVFQLVALADFLVYYVKSIRTGKQLILSL